MGGSSHVTRSKPGERPAASSFPRAAPGSLVRAVRLAGQDAAFLAAMADVYRRADAETTRGRALCLGGGACCKFDLTAHRLYLSTGELAFLCQSPPADPRRCRLGRCPYQVAARCSARQHRPLGCRLFFCDPRARDWSRPCHERYHREIQLLHERRRVPYLYAELTGSLANFDFFWIDTARLSH